MAVQIQFEFATRDTKLTRIEQLIAKVKREYGHAQMKEDTARIKVFGRRLWKLQDLKKKWSKAYIESRGL